MDKQIDYSRPRYETIGGKDDESHYPGSPWEIGDILAVEKDGDIICRSPIITFHPSISVPATEAEYNEYNKI